MADLTVDGLAELSAPAANDEIGIWDVSAGQFMKIQRSTLVGGTITGGGTIATQGFTLTVPATGVAAIIAYGTWTPVLVSSGATFSWSVAAGKYWNIGNITYFNGILIANGAASGTLTNVATITGLPFPAAAIYPGVLTISRIFNAVYPANAKRLMLYLAAESQAIALLWERDDNSNLDAVAFDLRSASFGLYFGGFYAT